MVQKPELAWMLDRIEAALFKIDHFKSGSIQERIQPLLHQIDCS